ncbi:uncharacterized protein IL334_004484 [Kwoniella shivajii]|uniref:Polysaccharide lyase 14 domain-containing protein n=1 Tax=Kwoniella shivajii TaxID=564305 RepID=A0ABZ1D4G7_9TREE|nr:hypothetical protein IL334_004484 [Kwoniella shivajii]
MPASNRWTTILTILSTTSIIISAAPLPQASDFDNSISGLDASGSQTSFSSSSPITMTGDDSLYQAEGDMDEASEGLPAGLQWQSDAQMADLDTFSISNFSSGFQNMAVLNGSPKDLSDISSQSLDGSVVSSWDNTINSLRVTYPAGSMNPGNNPRGGSTFYAHPVNMRKVHNATLEYSVFFPSDFDFVKGGKLPGLYGGHSGCAGGVDARDCFSTRMMWRENGHGELYLYAPRHRQTQRLCSSPPYSDCSTPYGLSIGRGSWTFQRGAWTDIRQDVWLNTPGKNDGGFNIWINGKLVVQADDVFYRDSAETCLASMGNNAISYSGAMPFKRESSPQEVDTFITEDWLSGSEDLGIADVNRRSEISKETSLIQSMKDWLSSEKMDKRAPYDDGHWKGINGYPGDPGYNGGSNIATGQPGEVYTYQFTEVVTIPTALATATITETETATVTVTAAPDDPPAEDPPAEKRNIKRQEVPNAMITGSMKDDSFDDSSLPDTDATAVDALGAPVKPKAPVKAKPTVAPVKPAVPPPVKPPVKTVSRPASKPIPPPPKVTPPPPAAKPAPPATKAPVPAPPPPAPKAPVPVAPSAGKAPIAAPPPTPPAAPKAPTPPKLSPPAPKAPDALLSVPGSQTPAIITMPRPHRHIPSVACERGFIGLFFSTFFGGHTESWASPREQNTYFRNFRIRINQ